MVPRGLGQPNWICSFLKQHGTKKEPFPDCVAFHLVVSGVWEKVKLVTRARDCGLELRSWGSVYI